MVTFSPNVERWRATVKKYVPDKLVDAALWIIEHESGGNPASVGDNGCAVGLFQIHHGGCISGRPGKETLLSAEQNIAYAAQQLGIARANYSAWGEGTRAKYDYPYDPETGKGYFGALGHAPGGDFPSEIREQIGVWAAQGGSNSDGIDIPGLPFDIPVPRDIPGQIPGVGTAIESVTDLIGAVGGIVTWMLDPHNWARLAFTILGGALIAIGLAGLMRKQIPLPPAAEIAASVVE